MTENKPISKIFNMDCMEFMQSIPNKFFDLAICDPPYGLAKKSSQGGDRMKNRRLYNLNEHNWDIAPSEGYFNELFRISKNQIIWGGNYFPLPPTRCFVCWDKKQAWENFSQCELAWTSFNKPAKLISLSNGGSNDHVKWHPTAKPIELYAYLLRTFAQKGDKIIDTHLGSGSSRIAAYKMGFDFFACEINETYVKLSEERFRRECFGEIRTPKEGIYIQQSLF